MPTVRVAAALVVALVCGVPAAFAQSRSGYPAVFGGAASSGSDARDMVVLSMSVTEAYDDDLLAEAGATPAHALQAGGVYTSLTPQVSLQTHGRRLQFSANGASSFRHYPSFSQTLATNHNAAAGFSANVGQETTVIVNQAVSYAPTYLYALFAGPSTPIPGEPIAAAPDYQSNSLSALTYGTHATVTHSIDARTSVSFNGDFRRTDLGGRVPGFSDMRSAEAGGRFAHAVSRGVSLRLGYAYRQARYSALLRTVEHDLEIGIDYRRPLSPSRRSTIGFSLGPTLIQMPFEASQSQGAGRQFRLTGDAFLERQIGRSWSARAAYHRGLSYVEALAGPVYTDSASVEATGFANRRVDLSFSAAFATGEMASQNAAAKFAMYTADSRLRFALSRNWAAYIEGLFYDYAFDPNLVIVPGLPSHFTRRGVRGGLTMWLPVRSEHRAAR